MQGKCNVLLPNKLLKQRVTQTSCFCSIYW